MHPSLVLSMWLLRSIQTNTIVVDATTKMTSPVAKFIWGKRQLQLKNRSRSWPPRFLFGDNVKTSNLSNCYLNRSLVLLILPGMG